MNTSATVNELFAALAVAQGQIENPKRNKTVNVRTKAGGTYQFSYADFAAVTNAVRGPLSANALSYTQTLEQDGGGKFRLQTTLWHASGQYIKSETPLFVEDASNQSFGSALTFMKRYALSALLGIAADDDDDANGADGNSTAEIHKHANSPQVVPPAADKAGAVSSQEPHRSETASAEFIEAQQYELRWRSSLRRAVPSDWKSLAERWNKEKVERNALLWPDIETRETLSTDVARSIEFLKDGDL